MQLNCLLTSDTKGLKRNASCFSMSNYSYFPRENYLLRGPCWRDLMTAEIYRIYNCLSFSLQVIKNEEKNGIESDWSRPINPLLRPSHPFVRDTSAESVGATEFCCNLVLVSRPDFFLSTWDLKIFWVYRKTFCNSRGSCWHDVR